MEDAVEGELTSFASGLRDDEAAVRAAIVEPWSNGQTEGEAGQGPRQAQLGGVASGGQVTKLKLVKRHMYGRGGIDLLRARTVQPG